MSVQEEATEGLGPACGGIGAENCEITVRQRAELDLMGLEECDIAVFAAHFVGHRFDFIERRPAQQGWNMVRGRPLTVWELINHLRGSKTLGVGCHWDPMLGTRGRHSTRVVVIDLDLKGSWSDVDACWETGPAPNDSAWQELLARYDGVRKALGTPSMLTRSSESGGLHCYYLLPEYVELHTLRDPDGKTGAVIELLAAHGLSEQAGLVEVYPRGQYKKRGPQNRIRLPFGPDSVLLDPHSFDRMTLNGPLSDLRLFTARALAGAVHMADADAWIEEAKQIPIACQMSDPRVVGTPSSGSTRGPTDTRVLWEVGLTGAGQLNHALWSLAIELRRTGMLQEKATVVLTTWLNAYHNGQSRTFNASPQSARDELAQVVMRAYGLQAVGKEWGPLPGLSVWEARCLLAATSSDYQIADPETGEVMKRFDVQYLGFRLLQYAKQWILRELHARIVVNAGAVTQTSDTWGAVARSATEELSAILPDPARPEFVVPVPFKLRMKVDGIGKDLQWPLWRVLRKAGVFTLARSGSAQSHRAATYFVALDFGTRSDSDEELFSLEMAIARIVPKAEWPTSYSRHYARLVRREVSAGAVVAMPTESSAVMWLQELLGAPDVPVADEAA